MRKSALRRTSWLFGLAIVLSGILVPTIVLAANLPTADGELYTYDAANNYREFFTYGSSGTISFSGTVGGTATYSYSKNTLTLDNYNGKPIIVDSMGDLSIKLTGANTITGATNLAEHALDIRDCKSVSIACSSTKRTVTATLNCSAVNGWFGVYAASLDTLTIGQRVTVTAQGGTSASSTIASSAGRGLNALSVKTLNIYGTLKANGAAVAYANANYGLYANATAIQLSGVLEVSGGINNTGTAAALYLNTSSPLDSEGVLHIVRGKAPCGTVKGFPSDIIVRTGTPLSIADSTDFNPIRGESTTKTDYVYPVTIDLLYEGVRGKANIRVFWIVVNGDSWTPGDEGKTQADGSFLVWLASGEKITRVETDQQSKIVEDNYIYSGSYTGKAGSGRATFYGPYVKKLAALQKNVYLTPKAKYQLDPVAHYENGEWDKVGRKLGKATYRSAKPKVATVSAKGKVVAKKPGTTTIKVTPYRGVSYTYKITVLKKAVKLKSVSLTGVPKTMKFETSKIVKLKLNNSKATNIKVTITSSNPKYLRISPEGIIVANNSPKTVKLTVKAGKLKKVYTVKIVK